MRIRRAVVEDLDALAALEAEALGADAWSPALLRAGVVGDLPTIRYLVALDRGESVLGYAVASLVGGRGGVAELQRIAVTAGARRTGVGGALLAEATAEAALAGSERLLLEVREDNDGALAFYAASGFAQIARRHSYYGDGVTAVVMERPVRPGPPPQPSTPA